MNGEPLTPVELRCAQKVAPLAVEPERLRFSWALDGTGSARHQRAYQLVVVDRERSSSPHEDVVWDSGREASAASADIAYGGPPLRRSHRYGWKVRVWDEQDEAGPWSHEASFVTAPDGGLSWGASWVGLGDGAGRPVSLFAGRTGDPVRSAMNPPAYLRTSVMVAEKPVRALAYATALGVYQLTVNGRRVSQDVLTPGWTDYNRRLLYQAYDITGLLLAGENVLAAIVADGWACGYFGFDVEHARAHYATVPQLLAQFLLRFEDGTEQRIVTDETWTGATGAIAYADLLMGEARDPSREPVGWDRPGYAAGSWHPVSSRPFTGPGLSADPGPAVQKIEELPAKSVKPSAVGGVIADFGQNLTGWLRVTAQGAPGTAVEIKHAEMVGPGGELYMDNLRRARQTDRYLLSGTPEVLEPAFTLHGFRYAEVTGLGTAPRLGDFNASVVHSDIPRTGFFACSAPLVNMLHANIDWSQRGNFISIPTDCPQRDERLGWLGDAQVFVRTAAYNRDVASFFSKWLDDVRDAQFPSGEFPDFAPRPSGLGGPGAPAWADAGVIVPWTIYKMYGATSELERHFASMEAWMGHLERENPDRLWASHLGANYGDWLAPKGDATPRALLATAYWAYDAALMAEVAEVLSLGDKARKYARLFGEIREAFQQAFVNPDGTIASGTQTAYVLALHMGLVPEEMKPVTAAHLVDAIAAEDWHLTTGFVGVGYILPVLSSNGYSEVAYRLLEQRSYPSWLYPVLQGATTIWERWDGWTEDRGFQNPEMNSFNHYSLGSVGEWLYRFVLGIELAPGASGFDRLVLRAHPSESLTFAKGSFKSVRGIISSEWSRLDGVFSLRVQLPPNVTASVRVPSARPGDVTASNGLELVGTSAYPGALGREEAVFEIGSGEYTFSGPDLWAA
ncbi:MAG TPA: family 78 glycoside hydrolase catalytic domain [Acidimicrobiales bacterium]|nr:family 78 glycoside hydrolase catalytic domain [Acidimicrobiales bacterium]